MRLGKLKHVSSLSMAMRSSLGHRFRGVSTMEGNSGVNISYLPVEIVAESVFEKEKLPKTVIVDVRDEDEFEDGHIVGALHHPSELWRDQDFVKDFVANNLHYDRIVFHCQKSQVRGPTCASIFARRLSSYIDSGDLAHESAPQIFVMRGGFEAFYRSYRNRPDLVNQAP